MQCGETDLQILSQDTSLQSKKLGNLGPGGARGAVLKSALRRLSVIILGAR